MFPGILSFIELNSEEYPGLAAQSVGISSSISTDLGITSLSPWVLTEVALPSDRSFAISQFFS